MRQRLIALGAGVLFLAAVVGVAVVARGDDRELRKLPVGSAGARNEMATAGMAADMAYRSVTYVLGDGVSDPGKEAPASELRGGSAAATARVAKALGLSGEESKDGEAFVVGDGERSVRMERGGSWYLFEDGCGGPDTAVSSDGSVSCGASAGAAVAEPAPAETPPSMACDMPECPEGMACAQVCPDDRNVAPPPEPERPADLPSKSDAQDQAEEIFGALGFNVDDGKLTVQDGFTSWMVSFDPEVGGMPTVGLTQSVAIGSKGRIDSAHGVAVDSSALGDYPLAGLKRAVERLNDGSAFGGVGVARDDAAPVVGAPEPAIAPCEPGPAVDCGPVDLPGAEPGQPIEPLPMPEPEPEPVTVTLTDVRLALLHVPSFDGKAPSYLVPAYLFTTDDEGEIPVVAVTDELLEDVTPAQPEPDPASGGREPATGGGATGSCGGAAASASSEEDNAPLVVSVCTGPTEVKVGEEVTFDVTAYDEDAPIYMGDCRRAPEAQFGDEGGAREGSCISDCGAPPTGHTWDKEPGKHGVQHRHAYKKAGTYTATFSFQSGDACMANPYSSLGSASVTITVAE